MLMLVIVIEFVHSARTGLDEQRRGRLSGKKKKRKTKRKRKRKRKSGMR